MSVSVGSGRYSKPGQLVTQGMTGYAQDAGSQSLVAGTAF